MRLAVAFPGQGSQRKGMGLDLFERYPELSAEAGGILGYSVTELCQEGNQHLLRQTRFLQPTLFVIGALSYLRHAEDHPDPDVLAGHSLGEYTALFAAGSIGFADGVRLVRARAEIMDEVRGGGMLAVVGMGLDRVRSVLETAGAGDVDVANHNSPEQTVLSGPEDTLRRLIGSLTGAGAAKCVLLHVSIAAHSRYMAQAAERFGRRLREVRFAPPRIPVISNVTARPHDPGTIADLLTRHLHSAVRWWETMAYLRRRGVGELVELGPGRVLSKLWAVALERLPAGLPEPPPAPDAAGPPAGAGTVPAGSPAAEKSPAIGAPAPDDAAPAEPGPGRPPAPRPAPAAPVRPRALAQNLGSAGFRARYGLRCAYLAGATGAGANSPGMVGRLASAGLLGVLEEPASDERSLAEARGAVGRAVLAIRYPARHARPVAVDRCLALGVDCLEVNDPAGPDRDLVRFRFSGAHRDRAGRPVAVRQVIAVVPDLRAARAYLSPPGEGVLSRLVRTGALTEAEADAARGLPVAGDLCTETDSGWRREPLGLAHFLPALRRLADRYAEELGYPEPVHTGAGDGIGSPESAAAAFALGADFVVARSVHLTARESGLPDAAAALLADAGADDCVWVPHDEHFALGARVRAVRRGTLFPARANRLLRLHRAGVRPADLDPGTRRRWEEEVFRAPLDSLPGPPAGPSDDGGRSRPVMADLLRWYLAVSWRWAVGGDPDRTADYQVRCGPELAGFRRAAADGGGPAGDRPPVESVAEWIMDGAASALAR